MIKDLEVTTDSDPEQVAVTKQRQHESTDHSLRMVGTDLLKPHPFNEKIYGKVEPSEEFLDSMKATGAITTPILIDSENQIVSVHHRWAAAIQLGWPEVPVIVRQFENGHEELKYLVFSNCQRPISEVQKIRSYEALLEAEKVEAKERQLNPLPENFPEGKKGEARELAAKPFGQCGKKMEMGVSALRIAEHELDDAGKNEVIQILLTGKYQPALNRALKLKAVQSVEAAGLDEDFLKPRGDHNQEKIQTACIQALKDAVDASADVDCEAMPPKRQGECLRLIKSLCLWASPKEKTANEE